MYARAQCGKSAGIVNYIFATNNVSLLNIIPSIIIFYSKIFKKK